LIRPMRHRHTFSERSSVAGDSGRALARQSGFTLLETLLAVALVGLMLVGLNTFIFSMGELWGRGTDARLFEAHSRNVTNFLQDELRAAVLPPAAKVGDTPITPQEVKVLNANPETLLTFLLPEGSRLFSWSGPPLPEVVCSLQAREGEGLILLWHSRLETKFNEDPPRETVISPLVAGLEYDYYDDTLKTWSTETALKRGTEANSFLTPQRLRLKFKYETYTYDGIVALPAAAQGLPRY
jgi:prepilin-type N-terminal cleavage/methylation domain-containing protein